MHEDQSDADSWEVLSDLGVLSLLTEASSESRDTNFSFRDALLSGHGSALLEQPTPLPCYHRGSGKRKPALRRKEEIARERTVFGDDHQWDGFVATKPMASVQWAKYNPAERRRLLRGHTGRRNTFKAYVDRDKISKGKHSVIQECFKGGLYQVEHCKETARAYKAGGGSYWHRYRHPYGSRGPENEIELRKSFTGRGGWDIIRFLDEESVLPPKIARGRKLDGYQMATTYTLRVPLPLPEQTPEDLHPFSRRSSCAQADAGIFKYRVYHPPHLLVPGAAVRDVLCQDGNERTGARKKQTSVIYKIKRKTRRKKRHGMKMIAWDEQKAPRSPVGGGLVGGPWPGALEDDKTTKEDVFPSILRPEEAITEAGREEPPCVICLEKKPLFRLMKNCCSHPSACLGCLRAHYIARPQERRRKASVSYPLHCFWPTCGRALRGSQVEKLARNQHEIDRHYLLEAQAKAKRHAKKAEEKFRIEKEQRERHRQLRLERRMERMKAWLRGMFPEEEATSVATVLAVSGKSLACCPSCSAFFLKGGGCDRMKCVVCNFEFYFLEAHARAERIIRAKK